MSVEWLVVNDKDWTARFSPTQMVIYLLVPPTINRVEDHWEITFDASKKKKDKLTEHFDNDRAFRPIPGGYHGLSMSSIRWPLALTDFGGPSWLIIQSKAQCSGKLNRPNVDPQNSGNPSQYNLDPDDALGICFLEPTVVEKDGEWILTTTVTPTDQEKAAIVKCFAAWNRDHPAPKWPVPPKIRYPAKMQKANDEFWKALREWQQAPQGNSPVLEDFFHFTSEQQKPYDAWKKAEAIWSITGGEGPYPQPEDFVKEDLLAT